MTVAARLAGARPVFWEELTAAALAERRREGQTLVMLPFGATEQHGPHLPVGTDTHIVTAVCAYASAKTGVPVLPPIPVTVSVGHTPAWQGTVSIRHETLIASVRGIVLWLLANGWDRVMLVNSHFGNDATLRVAVDGLRTDHLGRLLIGLTNTFAVTPEVWARFTADGQDVHANRAETSLMRFLTPHLIDDASAADADDEDRTAGCVFSHPVAATSRNGVTGRPSEASANEGRELLRVIGDALADRLRRARTETPPIVPDARARGVVA